jgi:hypothetical protein
MTKEMVSHSLMIMRPSLEFQERGLRGEFIKKANNFGGEVVRPRCSQGEWHRSEAALLYFNGNQITARNQDPNLAL